MNSEVTRYENTLNDLVNLNVNNYCELGPGRGEISIALKQKGKNVCALEAPWDFENRTSWAKPNGINVFPGEFFTSDFKKIITEKVDCFTLIHCIAHLRFPPQIVFEQVYNKLEKGGYFYLSTVNGGSLDRVVKLFRGGAITEEVQKFVDMGEEYNLYCNPGGRYMIWDSWMHVKEYRDHELKKMFESVGFKVVQLRHRNNFKHWKTNLMCTFWPHLAEEIIIVGQKQ
ncbi:MAG TPA: methyltransferase domain-containing protein [Bacteroidia bacterium]|nr:methyltransferase domain-containing protein [Bacteroidia bacterium]